jgi:hypothetical protein
MKDIIILCAGPSIKDLADNIESFRDIDVPYLLINGHLHVYYDTFGSIGKYPKYVHAYTNKVGATLVPVIQEFLANGVEFLTNEHSYTSAFRRNIKKYTVLDPDYDRDNPENHTSSVMKDIVYLAAKGYERIFIYGCTGTVPYEENTHYKENKDWDREIHGRDNVDINNRMPGILKECNITAEIYNCNPLSNVNCFKKITVEESIRMLNGL